MGLSQWPIGSVATLVATLVNFVVSFAGDNTSYYDPYWSVAPPVLMLYYHFARGGVPALRELLVALVVVVWSVRLTYVAV